MKGKKTLFLFFILTIFLSSFVLVNNVNAVNYEWIQNNGFEDAGGNGLLDASFEDTIIGMWEIGAYGFGSYKPLFHSGTQSYGISYGSYDTISYNVTKHNELATTLNTSSFNYGGVYVYIPKNASVNSALIYMTFEVNMHFVSTGGTNYVLNTQLNSTEFNSWYYVNYTSLLTAHPNQIISLLSLSYGSFSGGSLNWFLVDDIALGVATTGQTTIGISGETYPWYDSSHLYKGINTVISHSGLCSAYIGYTGSGYTQPIVQDIPYLNSNKATSLSLYAKSDNAETDETKIRITVIYSDRTNSYFVSDGFDSSDGWIYVNALNTIIPNKLIIQIQIRFDSGVDTSYGYFDDVSLLASVEYGTSVFSWSLSPSAIEYTNFSFVAYQRVGYTFTGYLFDDNGTNTDTGSYTITTGYGVLSGSITGGVFSFSIPTRVSNVGTNMTETFDIAITTDTYDLHIVITAIWVYINIDNGSGDLDDGDTISGTDISIDVFTSMMILFIAVIVPSLILALLCAKSDINPLFGFLAGFNAMCIISVASGLLDWWILFVMVLLDIVMGLYLINRNGGM